MRTLATELNRMLNEVSDPNLSKYIDAVDSLLVLAGTLGHIQDAVDGALKVEPNVAFSGLKKELDQAYATIEPVSHFQQLVAKRHEDSSYELISDKVGFAKKFKQHVQGVATLMQKIGPSEVEYMKSLKLKNKTLSEIMARLYQQLLVAGRGAAYKVNQLYPNLLGK